MNTEQEREEQLQQLEWNLKQRGWADEAIQLIIGSPLVNKCLQKFEPEGEGANDFFTFSGLKEKAA